jgi:hypothetical protein
MHTIPSHAIVKEITIHPVFVVLVDPATKVRNSVTQVRSVNLITASVALEFIPRPLAAYDPRVRHYVHGVPAFWPPCLPYRLAVFVFLTDPSF